MKQEETEKTWFFDLIIISSTTHLTVSYPTQNDILPAVLWNRNNLLRMGLRKSSESGSPASSSGSGSKSRS